MAADAARPLESRLQAARSFRRRIAADGQWHRLGRQWMAGSAIPSWQVVGPPRMAPSPIIPIAIEGRGLAEVTSYFTPPDRIIRQPGSVPAKTQPLNATGPVPPVVTHEISERMRGMARTGLIVFITRTS